MKIDLTRTLLSGHWLLLINWKKGYFNLVKKQNKQQKLVTGKDHAKFNKRQKFYSKFLRKYNSLKEKDNLDSIIPLTMNKKFTFPEYDDLSLLLLDFVEQEEENVDTDTETDNSSEEEFSKDGNLEIPFIDDGYFLIEKFKSKELELVCQETFEDEDGNVRKGLSSNADYNYQSAYNFGIRILKADKLSKSLEKEAESPTDYVIEVKTKIIERRTRYNRPHKPFFTRRRRRW